jgi:anti-sigma factor ChrR (cupin superfamily)
MERVTMNEQRQEQAALYALGALTPPEAERFRAQLAADIELEFDAEAYETVVNELALSASAVAPSQGLREQLMARIAATPQEHSSKAKAVISNDAAFVMRFDEGNWKPLAPHVSCKILHRDPVSQMVTSLIKLEPGGYLPRHRHLGFEQTLVVSGDCIVNGETLYAGDFRSREMGTEDTEVSTQFGTTIFMIAPEHFEILDAAWAN